MLKLLNEADLLYVIEKQGSTVYGAIMHFPASPLRDKAFSSNFCASPTNAQGCTAKLHGLNKRPNG